VAEPYSDQELAAFVERFKAVSAVGYGDPRLVPTIERLLAERDEARAKLTYLTRPIESFSPRPQSAIGRAMEMLQRERNEAWRVARVLASDADVCDREGCTNCDGALREAKRAALAYPEVPRD
jgi:hypothetical protein